MACRLEVVVPCRSSRKSHSRRKCRKSRRKRAGYTCEYTVSHFELLEFVNREDGKVKVYICSKHREYSVTYPAKRLLLNPVPGSGAILYFYCQYLICKIVYTIDDIKAILS